MKHCKKNRYLHLLGMSMAALLLIEALPLLAGEVIDRIVVTVNSQPILQSDWEQAVRYEALVEGKPADAMKSPEQRKAVLDRLIDQELIRQQMQDAPQPTQQQVSQKLQEVRNLYAEGKSDEGWRAVLQRYGLNETELKGRLAVQLTTMRFIDQRLRPNVHIDPSSVEAYYREKLLPELRARGVKQEPLVEVAPKIEELLAQQRMDELLSAWLQNLRTQSEIIVR